MSTDEQFLNDAREFGLELAKATLGEVGAGISREAMQAHMSAMESVFVEAIEHIARRHGPQGGKPEKLTGLMSRCEF